MPRMSKNLKSIAIAAALLLIGSVSAAAGGEAHWSYTGPTGPVNWGRLGKDYTTCSLGETQSPINISDGFAIQADIPAIKFDYRPSTLKIIDNGHTIQTNYEPGSFITVGTQQYELLQFHFHKPSEEAINGRRHDMVAHLVHRDKDGKLAVVAILLSKGNANPLVQTLWDHLPKEKSKESVVDAVKINVADLLPIDHAYYTFAGSLTTPPCSEGVTWFVLRNPSLVSADQIARFGQIYPMNARPVQPLNGREIRVSH